MSNANASRPETADPGVSTADQRRLLRAARHGFDALAAGHADGQLQELAAAIWLARNLRAGDPDPVIEQAHAALVAVLHGKAAPFSAVRPCRRFLVTYATALKHCSRAELLRAQSRCRRAWVGAGIR